jgi:FKBP-type peptidyl-prolyl cis-trans isomerase
MKPLFLLLPALALLLPASAQDAPAPAAPPAATPTPNPAPGDFPSDKERRSYALGNYLAARAKQESAGSPLPKPDIKEILRGLNDVLNGQQSLDYSTGAQMGAQLRKLGLDLDSAEVAKGLADVMENRLAKLSPADLQTVMKSVQDDLKAKALAKRAEDLKAASDAATAFLAKNITNPGVTVTKSGLQYIIQKPGDGPQPQEGDVVTVALRGTLLDGTEFEKTPEGAPARKAVRALPLGLQEGIRLLKSGTKATFFVPPTLGFGESGRPPLIRGNSLLQYEVELISTAKAPQPVIDPNAPKREPITAVTPPVSVEVPASPAATPPAPATPQKP